MGQQFSYDGFGNLTSKAVTRLHGVGMSVTVDRHTNRISDYSDDLNGNQTSTLTQTLSYDFENRVAVTTNLGTNNGSGYGYDPDNRRMYTVDWDWTTNSNEMVHFYGVDGQRMGSYLVHADAGGAPFYQASMTLVLDEERVFFAGRLVQTLNADGWGGYNVTIVQQDRLGSVGSYYPYGEVRGTAGMFATYTRDAGGLDYAVNRWYSSGLGRFTSPDPYGDNWKKTTPGSWNSYSYADDDPVNGYDPEGLDVQKISLVQGSSETCWNSFYTQFFGGWKGVDRHTDWFNSDKGTMALHTFFEFETGDKVYNRVVWQGIANVIRNRWHMSNSDKVAFGITLDGFKPLVYELQDPKAPIWVNQELTSERRSRLISILNNSPDSTMCDGLLAAFEEASNIYDDRGPNPVGNAVFFKADSGSPPSYDARYWSVQLVAGPLAGVTPSNIGHFWYFWSATRVQHPRPKRPKDDD